ncbi:MAG TPA: PPOX class F420-dependent oxidoreductase [Chloroflexia bacterium]|nr:PPOX class F420-dependent oxidoreductase [Chloroflexia bacterium]
MPAFTPAEIAYLQGQRLARLATVDSAGNPYVVPVGFRYNADLDTIDIAGTNLGQSQKFRNVARTGRVALEWDNGQVGQGASGLQIRGRGTALSDAAKPFTAPWGAAVADLIRVTPEHITSWGIESPTYTSNSRRVTAEP